MSKIIDYVKATVLCIRFPFLYPRNRFSDLHHTCWKIHEFHTRWWQFTQDTFFFKFVKEKPDNLTAILNSNGNTYRVYRSNDSIIITLGNTTIFKQPFSYFGTGTIKLVGFKNEMVNIIVNDDFTEAEYIEPLKVIHTKWLLRLIKFFDWIEAYPIQWFHLGTTYTELDAMPDGWRKTFGIQMCKDIKKSLLKTGGRKALHKYRIVQIKEKFGTLRWYDAWHTADISKIIQHYEHLSYNTCISCGKPSKWISTGWISPYCDDCIGNKEHAKLKEYE